jgi:transposase
MENKSTCVSYGVDYHKDGVQVCGLDAEDSVVMNRRMDNSVPCVREALERHGPVRTVVLEACAGAADFAHELKRASSWDVTLAHPGFVRRMKANPDKTDYSDARMLATLARVGMVPRVWLAPEPILRLRTLTHLRQGIVQQRKGVRLRAQALLRNWRKLGAPGRGFSKAWLGWVAKLDLAPELRFTLDMLLEQERDLTARIGRVNLFIEKTVKDDPVVQRLLEMPAIGPVTAWVLRAQIGDFARFNRGKQLARYCGLSPCNVSSGNRQADAGLIRAGNPELKTVLIETGHRLARLDDRWKALAGSMRERGKPGSVIAGAIANRFVRWLWHELKGA